MMSRLAACLILLSATHLLADDAIVPADPQLGRPVDFNLDIAPLLEAKCQACHSRSVHEGDLVLESVETILKGGASGPGVVAGKLDESLIYKVCARIEEPYMPPQPNKASALPLTPRELGLLKLWIEAGAQPGKANPASTRLAWQAAPTNIQSVYSISLSADERFVAAGRSNRIAIYDLSANREVASLTDPALRSLQKADGSPLYDSGVAHLDFVHALAFSPNGEWLASAGYREVKLWKRQREIKLLEQVAEAGAIAIAVSADGTQAAVVLNNNTVRLWNLASGQPGPTLTGFPSPVTSAAFLPQSGQLLTGCDDGVLRIWNAADGQLAIQWPTGQPVKCVALTENGQSAISGHADGKLRTWSIPATSLTEPPQPLKEFGDHGGAIVALQLRPGANEAVTGCADGQIRRVNLDSGAVEFANAPGGPVASVAIAPNGEILAAAGGTANLARTWKRSGEVIAELRSDPALERIAAAAGDDVTVAKAQVAMAEAAATQADQDVKEREDSLTKANEARDKAMQAIAEPQKKADEAQLALTTAQKASAEKPDDEGLKKQVTDTEAALKKTQESLQIAIDTLASAERAIQLSANAIESAKANVDVRKKQLADIQQRAQRAEEIWNAGKQAAQQSARAVQSVAISPDGTQMATSGDDGLVHLWNAATGQWLETLHGHAGPVRALAYASPGVLVSAGDDQRLIAWDIRPQWQLAAVLGSKPADSVDISESPFVDRVLCLAFSPDSALLATGGGDPSRSGEVMIWDVASRMPVRTLTDLHSDTVFGLDFSRDGKLLASCGADKFVKVSEVATGTLVRAYEGHTGHVLGVSWKADGSTLASCGADNAIKIWNAETGEQRRTINNSSKQVTAIAFMGLSDHLVSSSGDTTVKFYNAGDGGNYRTFGGAADYVYGVAASRNEKIVVAGDEDGVVRVWSGENGQVIATFGPPDPTAGQTAAK